MVLIYFALIIFPFNDSVNFPIVLFLTLILHELLIIPNIIVCLIMFARHAQQYTTAGEVIQVSPYTGHYKQTIIRTFQVVTHFLAAIIQGNRKRSTRCHNELVEFFVSMRSATFATGYIIEIIDALNVERHIVVSFYYGQIASRVRNFSQVNQLAVVYSGVMHGTKRLSYQIKNIFKSAKIRIYLYNYKFILPFTYIPQQNNAGERLISHNLRLTRRVAW